MRAMSWRRGTRSNCAPSGLSDLHFPLLRSWQKPRFLPAETKLMSDKRAGARLVDRRSTRRVASREGQAQKAPQATFSNELAERIQRQIEFEHVDACLSEDVDQSSLLMLANERLNRRDRQIAQARHARRLVFGGGGTDLRIQTAGGGRHEIDRNRTGAAGPGR